MKIKADTKMRFYQLALILFSVLFVFNTHAQISWTSLSAGGSNFGLGLKSDGSLWAWGNNFYGTLGIGQLNPGSISFPMQIMTGGNNWSKVSAGVTHCLGIQKDSSLWAWGNNNCGELGDRKIHGRNVYLPESYTYSLVDSVPIPIDSQYKWVSVAAGYHFSLGIQKDGSLWAWGLNTSGQLGIGNQDTMTFPVQVGKNKHWVSVSAGYNHVLALQSDGNLWVWGDNLYGELGLGSNTHSIITVPTKVRTSNNKKWKIVSAGNLYSLAILKDSSLWAWGSNSVGQLGIGAGITGTNSPTNVIMRSGNGHPFSNKWLSISAGKFMSTTVASIGIQKNKNAWVWGGPTGCPNSTSPLPSDTIVYISSVTGYLDTTWTQVSSGSAFMLGLKRDASTFFTYGAGTAGELANGSSFCSTDAFSTSTLTCPGISSQPADVSVCRGANAVFTIAAYNVSAYQWLENNVPLTNTSTYGGVTTPVLTISNIDSLLNGKTYACIFYGNSCSAQTGYTSSAVVLSVVALPKITVTPDDTVSCYPRGTVLKAHGAISYSWAPSNGLSSVTGANVLANPKTSTVYTVTATSPICPVAPTATALVTVFNSMPISITPSVTQICKGDSVSLTGNNSGIVYNFGWQWSPSEGLNRTSGGPTVWAKPGKTTVYTVTVSMSKCPTTLTASATVSVTSPPTISISASSKTVCAGGSVSLTITGSSSYTLLNETPQSGSVIIVTPTATTTYSVITSKGNCTSVPAAVKISMIPLPALKVSGPPRICVGETLSLTATGASAYTWSPGNYTSAVLTSTPSGTMALTYTLTGRNPNGCIATETIPVSAGPDPSISIASSPTAVCPGGSVTLIASGADTYTWSSGQNASSIVVTPTVPLSTYTVWGDKKTCSIASSATATVSLYSIPIISVNNGSVCAGSTFTLVPQGAKTYTISGGKAVVSPTSTTSYTVTGTSAQGCINKTGAVATVTVVASPSITAPGGTVCPGHSFIISPSGAVTYTFPGNSSVVTPVASTVYIVYGVNAANCTASVSVPVNVQPLPTLSISASPTVVCAGTTATLSALGAVSYTWNTGAISNSIIVWPSLTTSYSVAGANTQGCTAGKSITLSVLPQPSLSVQASPASVCPGGSATLSASGATSYLWSNGSSGTSITVTPTVTSGYTVTGTQTGCSSSAVLNLPVTPRPLISISPAFSSICSGQLLTLNVNGLANAGTFTWSSSNPVTGSGTPTLTGSSTLAIGPSTYGTNVYIVKALVPGCLPASAGATVQVNKSALLTISPKDTSICAGSITLRASGAGSYTWQPGNASGPAFICSPTATSTYTVSGASPGCNNTASAVAKVVVNTAPQILISPASGTISKGSSIVLSASGLGNYTWSPATDLNTTSGPAVVAKPESNTTYIVNASAQGCQATASVAITVTTNTAVTVITGCGAPGMPASLLNTLMYIDLCNNNSTWLFVSPGPWVSMSLLPPFIPGGIPGGGPGGPPGGLPGGSGPGGKGEDPCRAQKDPCFMQALDNAVKDQLKEKQEAYWKLDYFTIPAEMMVYTAKNVFIGGRPGNYDESNAGNFRLMVNGGIRAKKLVVENNHWPDYVFTPLYKLMPLKQLSAYIQKNRHLPGIAAATTIQQQGQDAGALQDQMMQKIEELTLYAIHLKEKNKKLKKEIQELEKQHQINTYENKH